LESKGERESEAAVNVHQDLANVLVTSLNLKGTSCKGVFGKK
jgi:hypothetical protein